MKMLSAPKSLAWLFLFGSALALTHIGCDDGGGGGGVATAACSSCVEAYTDAQCKKWGDLAGCEKAALSDTDNCMPGLAGCSFENCKGSPICNDEGTAECASCDGDLKQSDCDSMGDAAGCSGATTGMFTACGKSVTGCHFEGCDFNPSCH